MLENLGLTTHLKSEAMYGEWYNSAGKRHRWLLQNSRAIFDLDKDVHSTS
ncbi:hypothetical protein SAMN05216456_1329 [Devosia crocina]|uniref:Uncharacterized protein n=1 Tax=Devosia crocina TaxID=429728 RepID=A0A1I7N9U1_9HYPH|nr:hypothetical protein SAMN05216456_1329 [Devosia crocina]